MRSWDIDSAHPARSYAMLLIHLAVGCFVPFVPMQLLAVSAGIIVGFDSLLVGILRLSFTASVSMLIHELVHACLLAWRNPDKRVFISMNWLRMTMHREAPLPVHQAFACAVLGPCSGAMAAMWLTGWYGPSFGWLVIMQQMACLVPPCDDGMAVIRCIRSVIPRTGERDSG